MLLCDFQTKTLSGTQTYAFTHIFYGYPYPTPKSQNAHILKTIQKRFASSVYIIQNLNNWPQLCSTRQHEMDKSKFLFYSCVLYFIVTMMSVHGSKAAAADDDGDDNDDIEPIVGGKNPITDEQELSDLVNRVKKNFKQLGETENGPNLEFVRVKSAEYRVVAGFIYTIEAEINENKAKTDCTIEG